MEKKTIGIAITGSFCTFDKMTGVIKTLTASGMRVIPIFSENVQHMDTRFGKAEDFHKKICEITGEQVIDTINYEKKHHSMIAHVEKIPDTIEAALQGKQIQPVIASPF